MYLEKKWPKIFDINIHQKINLSQSKGDSKEVSFQKEKKIEAAARLHATLINCYTVVTTSSNDVWPNQRPRYSWDDMLSSSSRQLCISYAFQKQGKLVPLQGQRVGGKGTFLRACVSCRNLGRGSIPEHSSPFQQILWDCVDSLSLEHRDSVQDTQTQCIKKPLLQWESGKCGNRMRKVCSESKSLLLLHRLCLKIF